jgi:hypothetical protein
MCSACSGDYEQPEEVKIEEEDHERDADCEG